MSVPGEGAQQDVPAVGADDDVELEQQEGQGVPIPVDPRQRADDLAQANPAEQPDEQDDAEGDLGETNQLLAVGAEEVGHNEGIIARLGRRTERLAAVVPTLIGDYTSCMRIEWDERKRKANLRKHQLDFADAWKVCLRPVLASLDERSDEYGEERWIGIGMMDETRILWSSILSRKRMLSVSSLLERP